MNEALETHFNLVDFTKNLLFNSTTKEQEEQSRHVLELLKAQEEKLIIM